VVNPWTGEMECKLCGSVHFASIKPMSGGKYYRGSWQCRYGCTLPDRTAAQAPQGSGTGSEAA
jgi:hypothetical protein